MGKKKKDVMDQMKDEFLQGAKAKKLNVSVAEKIFDLCYKFAEYGFNKSHSAAYAMISYQTAYLKTHYPNEYLLGLLLSVLGNTERTAVYVSEAKRLGIEIVAPNVNHSIYNHNLEDGAIVFGMGSIKGIGEAPVAAIVNEREANGLYQSVFDFFNRLKSSDVNKRVVEHLIKVGALDSLDDNRSKLLAVYEDILEKMQVSARHSTQGQVGLFQTLDEDFYNDILNTETYRAFDGLELLRFEKELTGEYLSGHPLDQFLSEWKTGVPLSDLGESFDKEVVDVVGVLSEVNHRMTKTNRPFLMAEIEDFGRKLTLLMFDSPKYAELSSQLKDEIIVKLSVKVKVRQSEVSLMVESVQTLTKALAQQICHVDIVEDQPLDELHQIQQSCLLNRGQIPLYFHIQGQTIETNKKFWINEQAIEIIGSIVGEQKVWLET